MSTRWTPDTCSGCSFDITHDPITGNQILISVVSKCAEHSVHDDFTAHGNALGENKMRMKVIHELSKKDPTLMTKDDQGNDMIDMSKFDYSFDADRKLSVFANGKTVIISLGEDIQAKVDNA